MNRDTVFQASAKPLTDNMSADHSSNNALAYVTVKMTSPSPSSQNLPNGDLVNTSHDVSGDTNSTHDTSVFLPFFIPCDSPQNALSPFVAEMVDLGVYAGILPLLVTCGVITNVINMAVFVRQGLSDRIHVCLFSLAVSDSGFLLFLMCGKSYAVISLVDPVAGNYWLMRHNGAVLGNYLGFVSISNTITTIIAVERCRCVLSPLKAGRFLRTRYMGLLIMTIAVSILAVENVILSLKYQTVEVTNPLTNSSTYISRLSPFYLTHRTILDVFDIYLISAIVPFTSLVIVTVCTTVIIVRLKVAATWRRHTMSNMTSAEKKDMMMTRMLVTVCCVYVTCTIPSVSRALLLFGRVPGFLITGHLCNVFKVSTAFTLLLEACNASANCVIYVQQSSQYRSTLRQLIRCVDRRQRKKKDCLAVTMTRTSQCPREVFATLS